MSDFKQCIFYFLKYTEFDIYFNFIKIDKWKIYIY